jgi:dienelactone hydrolase
MNDTLTIRELTDEMMSLYTQRKYAKALELVQQNANNFPEESTRITFWKMCLLSLCGRAEEVISVFQQGLDAGLWWSAVQFQDTDLDLVRGLPEFQRLVAISQQKYEQVREHIEPDYEILLPETPASGKYPLLVAVHGRNGNKHSHTEYWDSARQKGWLVLSVQSTQPLTSSSYCWDDPTIGISDLRAYYRQISQKYEIEPERVVIAGFSQGSGMAIYAALSKKLPASGFIGVGTSIAEPDSLIPLATQAQSVRGYFITGEKDQTLEKARAIQRILRENNVQFGEEVHADLGHEFPPDFEKSFDAAIAFIFKEQE